MEIKVKKTFSVNRIVIAICFAIFLTYNILYRLTGDSISTMILLGTDYKTFTLGLGEYFRLITSGFCHFSFLHFFGNMISLFSLGSFIEIVYGQKRYIIYLLGGILLGSLTSGVLNTNIIESGISSALYTFLVIVILYIFIYRKGISANFFTVLLINAGINFMPNVAWQAHLGGAVAGVIFFFIDYYERTKNKSLKIILEVMFVFTLIFLSGKYYSTKKDIVNYRGTDEQFVNYVNKNAPLFGDYYSNKIYNYYVNEGE